jgi:protein-S-isoprenylcysteine O-methyltransferase Ste14
MDIEHMRPEGERHLPQGMVHFVLSHSYMVYLSAVVLGVLFDLLFPFSVFVAKSYQYIGLVLIMLGTILIYWSQSTSEVTKEKSDKGLSRDFFAGPYKFSRNPTHIGLALSTIGLACMINSPFSIIFTVIAFIITKSIFLKEEEHLLEREYGDAYRAYKKKVNPWL